MLFYESDDSDDASPGGAQTGAAAWGGLAGAPPPSLPYKVDTSRPSLHTNWTRLAGHQEGAAISPVVALVPRRRPAAAAAAAADAGGRGTVQLPAPLDVSGSSSPVPTVAPTRVPTVHSLPP